MKANDLDIGRLKGRKRSMLALLQAGEKLDGHDFPANAIVASLLTVLVNSQARDQPFIENHVNPAFLNAVGKLKDEETNEAILILEACIDILKQYAGRN